MMEKRCGCQAHIVVNLGSDKKYRIVSMVEEHNHDFVSPHKRQFLRSNRTVSKRAKSTLFNYHKASIGTSQTYRLLHISEGGFQNVGCTLRDLQNYYHDLRTKIKDVDAQMFVGQLERKKKVNPAFFMTLWWMNKDDLFVSFGQMPRAEKTIVFLVMLFR